MLRFALSISLALLIAACPLTCRMSALLASLGAGAEAHAGEGCRHCCGGTAEHPAKKGCHEETPAPDCPCQNSGRGCICSGAVIDSGAGFEPQLLLSLDVPADCFTQLAAPALVSDEYTVGREHLSVPSGRCLRTAISSFLC